MIEIMALIISVMALLFALFLALRIRKYPSGSERMQQISQAIKEGAYAYLHRQYKVVAIFALIITFLLYFLFGLAIALGFLAGAFLSALAGYLGMAISVRTNVKTAEAAKRGLKEALSIAFQGGSVTGLSVVGLALLALSLFYLIFKDPLSLVGLGFGASLISLFARVGGGIYTKAADVGADLIGKVEKGIPEDDPRNPAVIADNVGDNVGDCAGMAADLYETYVITLLAAMLLSLLPAVKGEVNQAVVLPLLLGGIAILGSILGIFFVKLGKKQKIINALYKGLIASGIFSALGFYLAIYFTNNSLNLFLASLVGLGITCLIFQITDYYTSKSFHPVKMIAQSSTTGAGTNIISGLGVGLISTAYPVLVICLGIIVSYLLAGIYGLALAAVAMLSLTGIIISVDSYGPITDNAGGIAEMANLPKKTRRITDALDAVGNTTKAVTKGYAIGSAALGALALFTAFIMETKIKDYFLTDPAVLVGLFIGGLLPFIFSSFCMKAVGKAAFGVVNECRRQFKEIKGIMEGKAKPEYGQCVSIVTKTAQFYMIWPALLAILAPLLVGLILGIKALGGLLIGVIITGLLLAILMTTGGAAWDNAKKFIEEGNFGGKGSEAHKAAVVGDTVGDPFKDTAGPALNALIKVINTFSILFVPLFLAYGLNLI